MKTKSLINFINKFKLDTDDVDITFFENCIEFTKPSGEKWPVEYALFRDGNYEIHIYYDDVENEGNGDFVILETGVIEE